MNDRHTDSGDNIAAWNDLCPDGALRYYEGTDPDGFAAEMMALGIDVRAPIPNNGGWDRPMGWDESVGNEQMRAFWIPAGRVGEIYGSDRWPLGS
jgi:hypothetical protein